MLVKFCNVVSDPTKAGRTLCCGTAASSLFFGYVTACDPAANKSISLLTRFEGPLRIKLQPQLFLLLRPFSTLHSHNSRTARLNHRCRGCHFMPPNLVQFSEILLSLFATRIPGRSLGYGLLGSTSSQGLKSVFSFSRPSLPWHSARPGVSRIKARIGLGIIQKSMQG
jgi:hypothetical protein